VRSLSRLPNRLLAGPCTATVALVTSLVALLPAACTHDAPAPDAAATDVAVSKPGDPFLWSVEQGGARSYLFGTVHVGVDAERDLPKVVWRSFQEAKCFVMESDQGAVRGDGLASMIMLPADQRLDGLVKPATWAKLQAKLRTRLPSEQLAQMQPWFVAIVYLQTLLPVGEPMDTVFQKKAEARGIRVEFLEDWREALSAFASVTDQSDLDELVLHDEETAEETGRLVGAYRTGDAEKVDAVAKELMASEPDGQKKNKVLLHDRNARWLPRLTKLLREQGAAKGCFVAVGVGHLVGANNLREQLAQAGYIVRRVR
jgi:uncharacterized protein YbaP (TraB family)